MKDQIQQVTGIRGVESVWLGDASGKVYAQLGNRAIEQSDGAKLCRIFTILFAGLHAIGRGVEEIDVAYEKNRAIARGFHGSALVTLCNPTIEIALLRLTLNVVLAQMKAQPQIMAELPGWEQLLKHAKGEDMDEILASLEIASGGEV